MGRALIVPVHLDALCLDTDTAVTEPFVDVTRLPFVDPADGHDHRAGDPYLSEELLAAPFADQGLQLKAGVHLHWALPDALTRVRQNDGAGSVPVVPNRWLVTRTQDGRVSQQWVVESDFVSADNVGGVPYPYIADQMDGPADPPFRYLGRRVPLRSWRPASDGRSYLRALTALGYGEPTFASFYPHCFGVFGLHDPAQAGPPKGTGYDVLGWYADRDQDALLAALAKARIDGVAWPEALRTGLGWAAGPDGEAPDRLLCYGSIGFDPAALAHPPGPVVGAGETGVWVGNSPTEALAAHLGQVLPQPGGLPAPDDVENLLEAIAFADDLESTPLDVGLKLLEARHGASFRTVPGGTTWTIRARSDEQPVPAGLGDLLNALNTAQSDHDRLDAELDSLREELFADWSKYLLCAYPPETSRESYPDPDQVIFHLRRTITLIGRSQGRRGAVADQVTAARTTLERALAELPDGTGHTLQATPGPGYYLPNEPVVLLTGAAAHPSDRYGQDGAGSPSGLLECRLVEVSAAGAPTPMDDATTVGGVRDLVAVAVDLAAAVPTTDGKPAPPGRRTWAGNPWHPLLLQWEVEFFPAAHGNNLDPSDRDFDPDFITANYTLPDQAAEFTPLAGAAVLANAANVYTGSSVLSPAAQVLMSSRLLHYLTGPVLAALPDPPTEQAFSADPGPTLDRYLALPGDPRLRLLIDVYRHLATNEPNNLAQTLGGFNDALLMRRLARQLPVADPLGFPAYRAFAEQEVAPAIAGRARYTPQPLSDFNPIRAGALRVLRLQLVDSFGVPLDVNVDQVGTTTALRVPAHPGWVAMPPRLAQPARLSLRWLDAASDLQEMNAVPATSPICGWLLANHLDGSLAVHAADGAALGSLYALPDLTVAAPATGPRPASWRPAPGRAPILLEQLPDTHLRAVVTRLRDSGADAVGAFLTTLDDALAAIEPEDAGLHQGRTLLVSRPVAVTRVSVSLELQGRPAVHQDWNVFRQDLRRSTPETNGFARVLVPVRIGDHGRLNDGVVGYWLEGPDGSLGADFHAVQGLVGPATDSPVRQAIAAPPTRLTVLVDPRGGVHACTGLLPAKSIRIPAAHYRSALAAIEVSFVGAPVLTDPDAMALPLPEEPGYAWSWLERAGSGWAETSSTPVIHRDALLAEFPAGGPLPDGATVWSQLLQLGWLVDVGVGTASITPAEQRRPAGPALASLAGRVAALLDAVPRLGRSDAQARFGSAPTAREGWLTLRPAPTPAPTSTPPPTTTALAPQ